jgi:hypothetical protein
MSHKDHTERLTSTAATAHYDHVARSLVTAFATGESEAMRVVWDYFGHMRSWSAMRTYVRLDLGRMERADDPTTDAITLDDARYLVARAQGFATWDSLAQLAISAAQFPDDAAHKPIGTFVADETGNRTNVVRTHRWDHAIATLRERRASGIDGNGQLTDDIIRRLATLSGLESLSASSSSGVTDDSAASLARLTSLRHLDLSMCSITDRTLEILPELPKLERIALDWTNVTDAGARHLASCRALRSVSLMGTRTGDGAIRALAGHPKLSHLRTGNGVTSDGLQHLRFLPQFVRWHDAPQRMSLLSPDASPNFLMLRGSFRENDLEALRDLDGLFALNIDDASLGITHIGVSHLAGCSHLAFLSVDATDASMPAIGALPHLRFLMCQDTAASDDGWSAAARSQTIEHIWGRRCYGLGGRGFRALATMPALKHLSVSCKNVDDASLGALPAFPTLRELMPMDVPDDGYRHIAHCVALDALILMYCRYTTDRATEHIARLPALRRYFASYTRITNRTPMLLSDMPSLEDITFDSCAGLSDDGIAALARLPSLRTLRVASMPRVTRDVARVFADGVDVHWAT